MAVSSTDFPFGEDLETILYLIESDSLVDQLKVHQGLQKHLLTEEFEGHSYTECSKTFKILRGLQL